MDRHDELILLQSVPLSFGPAQIVPLKKRHERYMSKSNDHSFNTPRNLKGISSEILSTFRS